VILAIPNSAIPGFADLYRDQLIDAVIIDPSNPILSRDGGVTTADDLGGKTSGTLTAEQFPKSAVSCAFSHQLAETLWARGRCEPGQWAIGYAADDPHAAVTTFETVTQTGFVPIRVGTLVQSAPVDPGGALHLDAMGVITPHAMQARLDGRQFTR
jgi:8-hydroxy-5-deazaflavin:NADPH oxidoreductase